MFGLLSRAEGLREGMPSFADDQPSATRRRSVADSRPAARKARACDRDRGNRRCRTAADHRLRSATRRRRRPNGRRGKASRGKVRIARTRPIANEPTVDCPVAGGRLSSCGRSSQLAARSRIRCAAEPMPIGIDGCTYSTRPTWSWCGWEISTPNKSPSPPRSPATAGTAASAPSSAMSRGQPRSRMIRPLDRSAATSIQVPPICAVPR